ncbi:MAG: hypothetical protein CO113_07645 [Elusimicrobia bacterium CG_4_9_14_3_um_filter_62_55]|nr:MAG: hypothetical protein COR54_01750 [Elusimicrobia bacterium CG22_combo_CG10-13_8_21_14_all_63_91]PJA13376.1 MAG: hypothetical protein COX66_14950 [Elusimicrobia bacterium CG_4_10_14_0_2_um_filter_63_34]PJB25611.1 MAG: hypothetical protein CO113_07645 [Elusimicrobia bacterium CG_4_9_14_3_um_filter_62_55]
MKPSLAIALFLSASVLFAEEKIEEAPPEKRPTYTMVREDLAAQFKDHPEMLEGIKKNLGALEITRGFEDLHGYQILKTEDGNVLVNLELPDGRAVFYDPKKGEIVEMDPKNPDKLTRLSVERGQISRSEDDKRDTQAFMKPFGEKTQEIRLGGATGRVSAGYGNGQSHEAEGILGAVRRRRRADHS